METFIYFAVAATASRLIPIWIGIRRWHGLDRAATFLVVFVGLSLTGDLGMLVLGRHLRRNNLWISHLLIPVQTPVLLLAFREWVQPSRLARGLRIAAVFAVIGWLVVTLVIESPTRFARVTGPLQAALFCVAAAGTLVVRGLSADAPIARTDWFWASLGVLLVYGLTAVYRPLLDLFTQGGISAIPAWTVLKALGILQVIANLFFALALILGSERQLHRIPAPA